MNKYSYYQTALEKKREQKEYRQLRCVVALEEKARDYRLNFTSNDFLGLSQHPYIKKTTIKYVLEWGAGTTPSRLVTKHLECHRSIEEKLATLVGQETSLLFPSAYQSLQYILPTFINSRCSVFIDRYAHYSLIQAVVGSGAQIYRYEHNDLEELHLLLQNTHTTSPKWIVTESLFSIDGMITNLKKITEIAEIYGALTFIVDSNSVGLYGKHGMGLSSHRKGIDIVFGSFGKQVGVFGAFMASSALLREYLLAFNPQLLETTTLPPAVLGAISGALDLIPDMQIERQKVEILSQSLREGLEAYHWNIGKGTTHIIPLLCVNEEECQKLSTSLSKKNILTSQLRPPRVPLGTERLRLIVNAQHSQEDISFLIETLNQFRHEPSLSFV